VPSRRTLCGLPRTHSSPPPSFECAHWLEIRDDRGTSTAAAEVHCELVDAQAQQMNRNLGLYFGFSAPRYQASVKHYQDISQPSWPRSITVVLVFPCGSRAAPRPHLHTLVTSASLTGVTSCEVEEHQHMANPATEVRRKLCSGLSPGI